MVWNVRKPGYAFSVRNPNLAETSHSEDVLLRDLTPAQREAVLHTEGPLLVLAAAGSGKTRVITRRIAHLVRMGIPPWSILALTFTNKAAGEMRERTELLLGDGSRVRGLTVTTFHSLCARLLRRYAEEAAVPGIRADFTIYDSDDQVSVVKRVIGDLGYSTSNWPPRSVLATISGAKNQLCDAGAYAAAATDFHARSIAKIYKGYESALRSANAVDFDDLLLLTARMLRERESIRRACNERWQYLLIDEYQDTNHAQFVIAAMLAGGMVGGGAGPNICVVGDPDQSVYGWRGADISNILEFEEQYPSARVIALGQNFRSTAPILASADSLIRHNKRRKHKDLYTDRQGGDPVEVVMCRDERHEGDLVADWLRSREESGLTWRDMAVFYRNNALSRVVEDALRQRGIPYVIARGTAFFQREEVRHVIAYLRVVANPADEVSLMRIINVPTRGIGKASLSAAAAYAGAHGMALFDALGRGASIPGVSSRAGTAMREFREMVERWTGAGTFMGVDAPGSLSDLTDRIIKESGLETMYRRLAETSHSETDEERIDNLSEMVSSALQFESEFDVSGDPATSDVSLLVDPERPQPIPPLLAMLRAYLESIALVADADAVDPARGAVTLMTLHAAKGLEFPAVAMIGLEEGTLPHSRSQESESDLEEERRLCFVGITRAMRHLLITSAGSRTIRGRTERSIPSRFLSELDRAHIRVSDQTDDEIDELRYEMEECGLVKGMMVRHPQFGVGRVLSVDRGRQPRARVEFKGAGTKTLLLEYARLTVLGRAP